MFKQLKEGIMTMSHQIKNNNEEVEILKSNKMEILEWKSTNLK